MNNAYCKIANVYIGLSNILADRMIFLKDESEDIKKLAEAMQYTIVYTGSNVLKLYGLISRDIKDHDVLIKVYSDESIKIVNLIFRKWFERYSPEGIYSFDNYGSHCLDHFALKLNCEMTVDVFVAVNSDDPYLELPNPYDLTKTTIKLGLINGIFKAKKKFDSFKAMIDAMEMTVKLIRDTDSKKEIPSPF